jgi:hypothetical protein
MSEENGNCSRKEPALTDDENPSTLDRTFDVMLAELEDAATTLTNRQAELAREMADVDAELERVEAVRAAMVGQRKPARRRPATSPSTSHARTPAHERVERILAWARERTNGEREFVGADVADMLGVGTQGVGPVLAGMHRRGELERREDDTGRKFYWVP